MDEQTTHRVTDDSSDQTEQSRDHDGGVVFTARLLANPRRVRRD